MLHWQQDGALAGVRDSALDKLPAQEQKPRRPGWGEALGNSSLKALFGFFRLFSGIVARKPHSA